MKTRFIATLALLGALRAHAGTLETVGNTLSTTNYTGMVIAADAITGHVPDRSKITGSWSMNFTWNGADTNGANYESKMWFEDEDGNRVSMMLDGSATATTELVEVHQVSLDSGTPTASHAFTIAFRPVTRLLPMKRYYLRAQWRKQPAGEEYWPYYINVPTSGASSTSLYFHFTNTTSGDVARNAQALAELSSWDRPWMIQGSATQGWIQFTTQILVGRYDDFNSSNQSANIPVSLNVALKDDQGVTVWTAPAPVVTTVPIDSYQGSNVPAQNPTFESTYVQVQLPIPAGVLGFGKSYTPFITVTHDDGNATVNSGTRFQESHLLLWLDGTLLFGGVHAAYDQLDISPLALASFGPASATTTFDIENGHGSIPGAPNTAFDAFFRQVTMYPDGHAVFTDANAVTVSGSGTTKTVGGVTVQSFPVLSASGASGNVKVTYPDGFGVSTNALNPIYEEFRYLLDVPLGDGLALPNPLPIYSATTIACYTDRVPLVLFTQSLNLDSNTGVFTTGSGAWVDPFITDKATIITNLNAGVYANPPSLLRPTNAWVQSLGNGDACSGITIHTDASGRAQLSGRVDFVPGKLYPHFPVVFSNDNTPYGPTITSGHMTFDHDVIQGDSEISTGVIRQYYRRDIAGTPCTTSAGPDFIDFTPTGGKLYFTPDGGLTNTGTIAGGPVKWGTMPTPSEFAHQLPLFADGSFHSPGYWLSGDSDTTISSDQRCVSVLYAGFGKPGNAAYSERPGSAAYATGDANYAGITLRSPSNGFGTAFSRLADHLQDYDLTQSAHYYVRYGGVTGITDSDSGFFIAGVYGGFGLTINNMRLAFIDGVNTDSLTDGALQVGSVNPANSPVSFSLAFDKLFFGPQGQLTDAQLATVQTPATKSLRYWKTDFTPKAMRFRQPVPADGSCPSPGTGFLSIFVDASLPLLQGGSVQGELGFKGNGDLLGKGDPLTEGTGIDSRFQLPSNVKVSAGNGTYTLEPVIRAYLNRWEEPGGVTRPTSGFLNVAGRLDVPFFEAMKVHIHADTENHVSMMGGWEVADTPEAIGHGWTDATGSFFSNADFDELNIGFPGATVEGYRDIPGSVQYKPRVFKNWYGMVSFDYPLKRSASGGGFESTSPTESDVLLFNIKHKVARLTPTGAELNFDAALAPDLALPGLSMSSLLSSVGLSGGIATKFNTALGGGFNISDFVGAISGLDGLVKDDLASVIAAAPAPGTPSVLETGLTPFIDAIYAKLQTQYVIAGQVNGSALRSGLVSTQTFFDLKSTATSAVAGLVGNPAAGLIDDAADRLQRVREQAQSLSSAVDAISTVGALGSIAYTLAQSDSAPNPSGPDPAADVLNTLASASNALTAVTTQLQDTENALRGSSGALFSELGSVATAQQSGIDNMITQSMSDIAAMLVAMNSEDGQLLTDYPEAEMKKRIRNIVFDRFFGSSVASEYQRIFKSHLNPVRQIVQEQVDQIMAELEGAARAKLAVPPVTTGIRGLDLAGALKSNGLRGFARINGDSLETLRLDGEFNLNILSNDSEAENDNASGMAMKAWVEIQAVHSDGPQSACNGLGGAEGLTATLGAKDIPLGWGPNAGKGYAELKFGFKEGGLPVSFDGTVGMDGAFTTGGFTFSDPKIVIGAGPDTLYGGFALRAAFNGKEVAARALLGKICGTGPLQKIDPNAYGVLHEVAPSLEGHRLLGGSLYAEAWFPLNELIGIPTTCLLNLRAGVGGGFMFWLPDNGGFVLGMQQKMGLSGQVLCAIGVEGSLTMVGAGTSSGIISMTGIGEVSAEIGVCPFCVDFSKTIKSTATYNLNSGDIHSTGFDF